MKISTKKLVFGLMVIGVLVPFAAQAVTVPTDYAPLAPLPCIAGNGVDCSSAGGNGQLAETVSFQTYVQYTFNLLIALAAVASVFMMVYGGFLYMTSSAVTTKEDGLKKVYNAVGGLALVLCSFLILKTINPQFVQVPAGLVTPLNLHSENTSADWMTQLNDLSNNYQVQSNQAIAQEQTAIAANTAAQKALATAQKAEDEDCYTYGDGSPECTAATNAATIAQNNANQTASNRALNVANSTLIGISNSNLSAQTTSDLATVKALESDATKAYNSGLQGIQANGGDAAQQQQLTSTYTATQAQLLAQQYQQQVAAGTMPIDQAITNIQHMQQTIPNNLIGTTDKTNFTNGTNVVLTQLQNQRTAQQAAQQNISTPYGGFAPIINQSK